MLVSCFTLPTHFSRRLVQSRAEQSHGCEASQSSSFPVCSLERPHAATYANLPTQYRRFIGICLLHTYANLISYTNTELCPLPTPQSSRSNSFHHLSFFSRSPRQPDSVTGQSCDMLHRMTVTRSPPTSHRADRKPTNRLSLSFRLQGPVCQQRPVPTDSCTHYIVLVRYRLKLARTH
ncbi:hypothetical protein LX32DRAFT_254606 [Colletotrichum zoysiae]|uniref:Uncharacterized protein n=1 Tax=Colletotrichum zoysiae TaxID=1216348 RepID=A0AAD9MAC1_9PEZI|nr:hypothetical protein LX32DRAFT_254606 [Colletotrichum zoysiae]